MAFNKCTECVPILRNYVNILLEFTVLQLYPDLLYTKVTLRFEHWAMGQGSPPAGN